MKDSDIPTMKVGDIFYECEMGMNIECRVMTNPQEVANFDGKRVWEWQAENTKTKETIQYRLTEGLSHYGPKIYSKPQYVCIENGKAVFKFVGDSQ